MGLSLRPHAKKASRGRLIPGGQFLNAPEYHIPSTITTAHTTAAHSLARHVAWPHHFTTASSITITTALAKESPIVIAHLNSLPELYPSFRPPLTEISIFGVPKRAQDRPLVAVTTK